MAKIDDLMKQVGDTRLRRELEAAVAELKKRTRFGLVYESHLPEMTALPGLPITEGALVVRRDNISGRHAFRVCELSEGMATLEPLAGGQMQSVPAHELLALQRFGEPIYPGLEPVGAVERGGPERPHHAVINAENYHAAQLLLHLYEGQVDCLYLDPPYNTGARDWTYNNDYVDSNDAFRHSKWLSFMEKRLRLALRLLKPDGIMVITIDDYEVHHLRLLLETTLTHCHVVGTVPIKTSPSGRPTVRGFRTNHEYAFFVAVSPSADIKPLSKSEEQMALFNQEDEGGRFAWANLRKRGGANTHRKLRPKQFYPIYVSGECIRIPKSRWDNSKRDWDVLEPPTVDEQVVLPIGDDGRERIWSLSHKTASDDIADLKIKREGNSINILRKFYLTSETSLPSTWWDDTSYSVVEWGTGLLNKFFGTSPFPFAKSVYAVADCLKVAGATNPDALIVDLFGGSGTTLNAVCLLNEEDDGRRRCILVTNNEVGEADARALHAEGHYKGDAAYEKFGIFQRVTRPRCEAALTGTRPDGTPVPGAYIGGRPMADGFAENVTFFQLNYLDPDRVDMGQQFTAIAPLLWLQSGAVGAWDATDAAKRKPGFGLPPGGRYGVCFRDSAFGGFCDALHARPDVTHVFLVTNNDGHYTQMRAALPSHIVTHRLYRDYLRSFRLKQAP